MLGLNLKQTRVYQEAKEEGRQEEAVNLILRQLTRRLKQELSSEARFQVAALSLPLLEELGESLVDFEQLTDLLNWLEPHRTN